MADSPNNTGITDPQIEVSEVANEPGILRFSVAVPPILTVEGRLDVGLIREAVATDTRLLVNSVIDGKPVQRVLSRAGFRLHPKWHQDGKGNELSPLMDESIRDALKSEVLLMLSRIGALAQRAVSEGVVLVSLNMDENEIFDTPTGSKKKVLDDYADEVGKRVRKEIGNSIFVRARVWTKARKQMVLALYEGTYERLKALSKLYRILNLEKFPRHKASREQWAKIRAENSDLASVLNKFPSRKLKDLSVSYICQRLGIKGTHQVYKQIRLARLERRGLFSEEAVPSVKATISRVVDCGVKKGESK